MWTQRRQSLLELSIPLAWAVGLQCLPAGLWHAEFCRAFEIWPPVQKRDSLFSEGKSCLFVLAIGAKVEREKNKLFAYLAMIKAENLYFFSFFSMGL
jgi:hypothetical protein